jgi:deoxyribodipyrimidine photolyase-related protein
VESLQVANRRPYHKQKLVLIWSAMRHFARELEERGISVAYHAERRSGLMTFKEFISELEPERVLLLDTAEFGRAQHIAQRVRELGCVAEILPNDMFICNKADFSDWAIRRKQLRLEDFYRWERRRTGLLMDGSKPSGDRWNFDRENRKSPPKGHAYPPLPSYPPDEITQAVIQEVDARFPDHFGTTTGFRWPVDQKSAKDFFEDFIQNRLDLFGPYEDAMVTGQAALYHSQLSALINIGLLNPLELCRRAEQAYRDGRARLNSVEAFIRQILGWREFIYHVYHHHMPGYLDRNHLLADQQIPDFYWSGHTDMRCISESIRTLTDEGMNHHIQRLMVTGNLALLAGLDPAAVNEWFWSTHIDAYEWVVSPNVLGMALFADGGVLASKPYAASANYINKMSDYCHECNFDPKRIFEENACPFNALYWNFLDRNEALLHGNPRMNLMYSLLDRKSNDERSRIKSKADELLDDFISPGE